MLHHALAGVSQCTKAMRIMLGRSLPHPGGLDVTASFRRPAVPSMHGMWCCDVPWRQHGMQAVAVNTGWALSATRPMSTSSRKLVVQAATGQPVTAALAARAAVDPNSLRVVDTELHVEAERSYLAYAMSVIVGRALPDVRDGLKPVHRRILFAMHELGMTSGKPHRKCARVVGEVLGKYHPHGDSAVYNALVRLAQDFSMQAPLIDGHGNFGSLDNDPAAAMRYTECRLRPLTSAMLLADLDSDTVDMTNNFDESQEEPTVLPSRVPHLLVNGAAGIAVGIATNIPPHNLREVVDGLCALIRNPEITVKQLMQHIPAPDFPTGGIVMETANIGLAYHDGRGSISVRGRAHIEEDGASGSRGAKAVRRPGSSGKAQIIITELPYQSNKATFVETVAKHAEAGIISGISDIRDESDRDGMRVVVELKRGVASEVVLNNLYKHTVLQTRFACNMVALVDGKPLLLDLKQFLSHFLEFRCAVVRRRASHQLSRASARLHLVEGFLKAMADLDQVVRIIRGASDSSEASSSLQQSFAMSREQSEGVLNLSLRRLTSLEAQNLQSEHDTLIDRVKDLQDLLQQPSRVLDVVEKEARKVAADFGQPRRSQLLSAPDGGDSLTDISVIPNEPNIIVVSKRGFIKRMPADTIEVQNRNGRGKTGAKLKTDDSVEEVLHVMSHDSILFFTEDGVARTLRAYQIPEASRTAVGAAITQVLPIGKSDVITALLAVKEFTESDYLLMLTAEGTIKKTPLQRFEKMQASGLSAIKLRDGDKLRWVDMCTADCSVIVASSSGHGIHFKTDEAQLRTTGRGSVGIRAQRLAAGSVPVGMAVLPGGVAQAESSANGPWLLLVTANGLAKRVALNDLPQKNRGGAGYYLLKTNEGDRLVALHVVGSADGVDGEELLLGSAGGMLSRIPLSSISVLGRNAKGVGVLRLQDGDEIQTVTPIAAM